MIKLSLNIGHMKHTSHSTEMCVRCVNLKPTLEHMTCDAKLVFDNIHNYIQKCQKVVRRRTIEGP
jgi:hypothetical protein